VGELKIAAVADLGGLGAKEGPSVIYDWSSSLLATLLPWVGILCLLGLKPNRRLQAWWIWAPLGCLAGATSLLPVVLRSLPSSDLALFQDALGLLSFGLAAAWLVSTRLESGHRFVGFLRFLGVLLGFGLFSVLTQFSGGWDDATLKTAVLVGVNSLVIAAALILAGLLSRRRYRPAVLCRWIIVLLLGLWLTIFSPFFVLSLGLGRAVIEIMHLAWVVLTVTGLAFGVLLPFLILSFANAFYRERLIHLLQLTEKIPQKSGFTTAGQSLGLVECD
jgi:hypothetical protein